MEGGGELAGEILVSFGNRGAGVDGGIELGEDSVDDGALEVVATLDDAAFVDKAMRAAL